MSKTCSKGFGMDNSKSYFTPMSTSTKLDKDEEGKCVDSKRYRSKTLHQLADIFTMPLDWDRFYTLRGELGMMNAP